MDTLCEKDRADEMFFKVIFGLFRDKKTHATPISKGR